MNTKKPNCRGIKPELGVNQIAKAERRKSVDKNKIYGWGSLPEIICLLANIALERRGGWVGVKRSRLVCRNMFLCCNRQESSRSQRISLQWLETTLTLRKLENDLIKRRTNAITLTRAYLVSGNSIIFSCLIAGSERAAKRRGALWLSRHQFWAERSCPLHEQAGLPVAELVFDAPIAKPINIENGRNKFPLDFVHFLLSSAVPCFETKQQISRWIYK